MCRAWAEGIEIGRGADKREERAFVGVTGRRKS
jgi:hypothetical protein